MSPLWGWDPFGIRMLKGVIRDLSSKGVTIFLATHSLHIAEELCHRVGFINKGSIISIKTKEEIKGMEGGLEGLFLKMGGEINSKCRIGLSDIRDFSLTFLANRV